MINQEVNKREAEKMKQVDKLIASEILTIGQKAQNNPETIDFPNFCLGIANKDYPAMTPHLWNSVYEALNLSVKNVRLFGDPGNIEQIFKAFKQDSRYKGGDVGVGFKDKACEIVDELDPLAEQMQAINVTVKLPDGRLKGYNTDGLGYAISLEEQIKDLENKKIVILGAGGTSNAIAYALAAKGAKLVILNRTVQKAESLTQRLNKYFNTEVAKFGGRDQICTEILTANAVISVIDDPFMPLDKYSALGKIKLPESPDNIDANLQEAEEILKSAPKDIIISDVMLRNEETATIREAKKQGLKTLDGKPMVLYQAIEAFWLVNQALLKDKGITKEKISQIMHQVAKN